MRKMIAGPGLCTCDECVAILEADGPVEHRVPEWSGMSDEELAAALPRIAKTAAQVETGLRDRVLGRAGRSVRAPDHDSPLGPAC